jgi:4-hydroxy 2-oxovalerate aldolase
MRLLDCTLRDGGYYTNWDFSSEVVDVYIKSMNLLPIDYLEIGYRNLPSQEYLGKFGYCPVSVVKHIRNYCNKKLAIMLNEKNTRVGDLEILLKPLVGLIDMVRIAVDPRNFDRALLLAKAVNEYGFEVGFNVMYMSIWLTECKDFINKLPKLGDSVSLFCMVDSFGGVTPEELTVIYNEVRSKISAPIGFHGHNNLQLSLINTITAMKLGVDYVDATVLGMGRGAGNLNTELLLTYLNAHEHYQVDFNILGNVVSIFTPLLEQHRWGTNLPYMISGANRIPQKEVMNWVTNRIYSFNSIVRALDNRKHHVVDNAKYPVLDLKQKFETVLIVGGGNSVNEHLDGIVDFVNSHNNIALVFATARHAKAFEKVACVKYYVLVGTEGRRLSANVVHTDFRDVIILPPYPRMMGTEVPDFANTHTFELPQLSFIDKYQDSSTAIAVQTALGICDSNIFCIGYDGYPGNVLSEKEVALTHENMSIFNAYAIIKGQKMKSLTPSLYRELNVVSLYQFI